MLSIPEAANDDLPTMLVGAWSRDNHHYLRRYIDAFTTAMKGKRWSGLHYIDLFAGPGLLRIKRTRKFEWGSPLIAAHSGRFDGIHVCDKNRKHFDALSARFARLNVKAELHLEYGDANKKIHQIVSRIPERSLSLAFLDPSGLHLDFETLRVLAKSRRADLVIFFPDHLDALRNWKGLYKDQPNSNLDRVLGERANWRAALENASPERWAGILRDLYIEQIRTLGYKHPDHERIAVLHFTCSCSSRVTHLVPRFGAELRKRNPMDNGPSLSMMNLRAEARGLAPVLPAQQETQPCPSAPAAGLLDYICTNFSALAPQIGHESGA